jgi:hypothetical protein
MKVERGSDRLPCGEEKNSSYSGPGTSSAPAPGARGADGREGCGVGKLGVVILFVLRFRRDGGRRLLR